MSTERLENSEDDVVDSAEVNTSVIVSGEMGGALAVSEGAIHVIQRWSVNWGEPIVSVPKCDGTVY